MDTGQSVPTVTVQAPSLDQSVAVGEKVTLVYDAPNATSVRAFYDHDGRSGSGDEVTFASNLSAGTNQVVQLTTSSLPTGRYYLGIAATSSTGTTTAYATGRITLVGNTSITFLSPVTDLNIGPGVTVPIRFDAGLTDFSYRLFYDRDTTFNGNEVTIAQSSSGGTSLIEKSFDTSSLAAGTYNIGVTVDDLGGGQCHGIRDGQGYRGDRRLRSGVGADDRSSDDGGQPGAGGCGRERPGEFERGGEDLLRSGQHVRERGTRRRSTWCRPRPVARCGIPPAWPRGNTTLEPNCRTA